MILALFLLLFVISVTNASSLREGLNGTCYILGQDLHPLSPTLRTFAMFIDEGSGDAFGPIEIKCITCIHKENNVPAVISEKPVIEHKAISGMKCTVAVERLRDNLYMYIVEEIEPKREPPNYHFDLILTLLKSILGSVAAILVVKNGVRAYSESRNKAQKRENDKKEQEKQQQQEEEEEEEQQEREEP